MATRDGRIKVIGVDPGTRVCGWGVVEGRAGEVVHVESGALRPSSTLPAAERLRSIYEGLLDVIRRAGPDCMSIESVFFARNARSALRLGEARGVAVLAAATCGLEVHEYAPAQVKLLLTGRGRATKAQVQRVLSLMLGVERWETQDVSDAVAIAVCHVAHAGGGLLGEAALTRRRRRRFTPADLAS